MFKASNDRCFIDIKLHGFFSCHIRVFIVANGISLTFGDQVQMHLYRKKQMMIARQLRSINDHTFSAEFLVKSSENQPLQGVFQMCIFSTRIESESTEQTRTTQEVFDLMECRP
jgi:hypothetical protein